MVEDDPSPTQLNRFCSQKVTILCKKTLASKYLQLRIAAVKKASPQNNSHTFVKGSGGAGGGKGVLVLRAQSVLDIKGAPSPKHKKIFVSKKFYTKRHNIQFFSKALINQ